MSGLEKNNSAAIHYLDNSATTQTLKSAADRALYFMTEQYGNPSSLHHLGFQGHCALNEAREIIASSLGVEAKTVVFTSGGTEANNLAIFGAVEARKRLGNRVVTTQAEHASTLEAAKRLEKQGYEVIFLSPDKDGKISEAQLQEAITEKTILVSLMLINNETGAIQDLRPAASMIKRVRAPALLHTDAVQAYLKRPFSIKQTGVDLLTISGHKVHAPKGVGALYISEKARILPRHFGGGQEGGMRPGTESLPLIAAFAQAVKDAGSIDEHADYVAKLNLKLRESLADSEEIVIHSPDDASPYILNFSAGTVKAETMLHFLSAKGIFVSSGSACGRAKPSHVLTAMGVSRKCIESALRVSFSRFNVDEDVYALAEALTMGLKTLKRPRERWIVTESKIRR